MIIGTTTSLTPDVKAYSSASNVQSEKAAENVSDAYGYQFGDLLKGNSSAKTQAYLQDIADTKERAFNAEEAQKTREYEEYMSSTQYQRAAKDLEAAGLNPWLAVSSLNGSTPSSYSATSSAGQVARGEDPLGNIAKSVASAALLMKAIKALSKIAK